MKNNLKITKDLHFHVSGTEVVSMPMQVKIVNRISGSNYEEAKANAELLADSLETSNKTGLLPSELLKQRDKLKNVLEAIIKDLDPNFDEIDVSAYKYAKKLIKSIERNDE